jgi:hypothetical protein
MTRPADFPPIRPGIKRELAPAWRVSAGRICCCFHDASIHRASAPVLIEKTRGTIDKNNGWARDKMRRREGEDS